MKEVKDDIDEKTDHALGLESQYCQNDHITHSNLQIQCNPYQITSVIFSQNWNKAILSNTENKAILRKKKWSWRNQALQLQIILRNHSHQNSMVLAHTQKTRNIDQWNKIESPEINPSTSVHLIYNKGGENIQWRKDILFNKWCCEKWTATCKKMKLEHSLTPYKEINSNRIKDLNIRPDTVKLLEETIGQTLSDINQSIIFLDLPPRLMTIKTKINK